MPEVNLEVNGKRYEGWTDVSVKRSIRAASGSFDLNVTENWSGSSDIFFVSPGDSAKILIGDSVLITGFIESLTNAMAAESHSVSVSGRDTTCDLIDCSAIYKTGQINNADLAQIARLLAEPFGISVKAETDVGPKFSTFVLKPGETVFEALERGARLRGVMFSSDGQGSLVIAKIGSARAKGALVEGENIKSATLSIDMRERFSDYVVKAQMRGSDEQGGVLSAQIESGITDATVKRYRPLVVLAEQQASSADAKKRAQWEAAVRAANASKIDVAVQGFEQVEGVLWRENEIVSFDSPLLGLKQEFLISEIEYRLSETGSETSMTLQKPDAFLPEPEVSQKNDPVAEFL